MKHTKTIARTIKQTVDYFSHDCDASSSKTLSILEELYGNDGYAVWFKLLEGLGRSKGFYIDFSNERDLKYWASKAHLDVKEYVKIIDELASLDAIDIELWTSHKIIWSQNFVDRLAPLFNRRTGNIPEKPFSPQEPQFPQQILSSNVVSDVDNPQSIEKQSRQDQRKEKERKEIQKKIENISGGGLGEPLGSPMERSLASIMKLAGNNAI